MKKKQSAELEHSTFPLVILVTQSGRPLTKKMVNEITVALAKICGGVGIEVSYEQDDLQWRINTTERKKFNMVRSILETYKSD